VATHHDDVDGRKHVSTDAATCLLVLYATSPFRLKTNGRLMSTYNRQQRDRNFSHCSQLLTGRIVNQLERPLASVVHENNEKVGSTTADLFTVHRMQFKDVHNFHVITSITRRPEEEKTRTRTAGAEAG